MDIAVIRSKYVEKNNGLFITHIGGKGFDFGLQIHSWGIRIMLIWWHICIHIKD